LWPFLSRSYTLYTTCDQYQASVKIIDSHYTGRQFPDDRKHVETPHGPDERKGDEKYRSSQEKHKKENEGPDEARFTGGIGEGEKERRAEVQAGKKADGCGQHERPPRVDLLETPACLLGGAGRPDLEEPVKDKKQRKDHVGGADYEVSPCGGQEDCLAGGPGNHAKKEVADESSGEELGNDGKILPHSFSLAEEIGDEDRGAIGDAHGAAAYSENKSLHFMPDIKIGMSQLYCFLFQKSFL